MKYRPEVDGLRAVAVIPVILFHAGFELFSGGFVGVDVFFVISGYLITTIIINELEKDKFSIKNFYERRARRILPALFAMLIFSVVVGWFTLTPAEHNSFSQSLVGVGTFVSNMVFWKQSGYFDTEAELKPLLHTWSLAVEEQYYVFFPLLLMFAWRFGNKFILVLLSLSFLGSLALAQWGISANPSAAFFLLPTRGWELLIGAFCAFYLNHKPIHTHNHIALSQFLAVLGLALILAANFGFDSNILMPGLWALVPTVGTALIILFADKRTFTGQLLANKLFVGIGLISYSTYLWHQPLFAFARQISFYEISLVGLLIICLLSLVFGYLSWRFVERPWRDRNRTSTKTVFVASTVGLVATCIVGGWGMYTKGFPSRVNFEWQSYYGFADEAGDCFGRTKNFCNLDGVKEKIFVLGDSTILPLASGLRKVATDYDVVPIASAGCVVIKDFELLDRRTQKIQNTCTARRFEVALETIKQHPNSIVVWGGMLEKAITSQWPSINGTTPWRAEFIPANDQNIAIENAIKDSIKAFDEISERVYLVQFPQFGYDVQRALFLSQQGLPEARGLIRAGESAEHYKKAHAYSNALLEDVASNSVRLVDTLSPLCKGANGYCSPALEGRPMYSDHVHPSSDYVELIAKWILGDIAQ